MMLLTKEKGSATSTRKSTKIPKFNPITICQLRKSVKKSNPCSPCNPCLNFCPSPKADGHYYSLIYSFSVAVVSPAFGVDTNQKKKHGYHRLDTDWSFTDLFFDIIWLMILGLGLWIYLDLRVLTHSLSWRYGCLLLHISTSAPT